LAQRAARTQRFPNLLAVANEKAGELAVLLSEVPLNKFFINV